MTSFDRSSPDHQHDHPRDHPGQPQDLVVALPRRWVRQRSTDDGVVLAARAREVPRSGVAPELVLRSTPLDTGAAEAPDGGLHAWAAASRAVLETQLDGLDVEDEDTYELDGRPVLYRRFSHRAGGPGGSGGRDVVCDQWSWVADGVAVTLTGSVARADYLDYCDLFEDVAATVELGPGAIRPGPAAA